MHEERERASQLEAKKIEQNMIAYKMQIQNQSQQAHQKLQLTLAADRQKFEAINTELRSVIQQQASHID